MRVRAKKLHSRFLHNSLGKLFSNLSFKTGGIFYITFFSHNFSGFFDKSAIFT